MFIFFNWSLWETYDSIESLNLRYDIDKLYVTRKEVG